MWCMFPTMLMATNDVRLRDPDIEAILLNNETIAVNRTNLSTHEPAQLPAYARSSAQNIHGDDMGESGLLTVVLAGRLT